MRISGTTFAVCVLLGSGLASPEAQSARPDQDQIPNAATSTAKQSTASRTAGAQRLKAGRATAPRHAGAGGISCVPYARGVTGMQIYGDGRTWWHNAAGSYDRGRRPEPGSVMAFQATGGMTRGHVAVVSRVLHPREVLIDHANWGGPGIRKGTVMHGVSVIDISDRNDWSAVRVQSGHSREAYGKVYPLYGFIYNRPDMDAATAYAAARPRKPGPQLEQVAEEAGRIRPASFQPQGQAPLRQR